MPRRLWVIAHRWAGLTIALFLAVAGITGSFLVFYDELDALAAPALHRVNAPAAGIAVLDPQTLRERVLSRHPGGVIDYLPLHFEPGRSVSLSVERRDPQSGALRPWSTDWDELFVDPYSGGALGHRRWGDISQGMINLMPFLYRLHYSFALGHYGMVAFGIAALIWTVDCFIGLYLTFPVRVQRRAGLVLPASGWLARWRPSWLVRRGRGGHRLAFDAHRAGGLWMWPLLLVFAWSGVSFTLTQVYNPVMTLFGYVPLEQGIVPPSAPRYAPRLDFRAAQKNGEKLAEQQAQKLGLSIRQTGERGLFHRPDAGVYAYTFSSSADIRTNGGRSLVIFDSNTGGLVKLVVPQGQAGANTLTELISALHMAALWGLPWRIVVGASGLLVTVLSVTGVMIWLRKRSARHLRRGKISPHLLASPHPERALCDVASQSDPLALQD